MKRFRAFAGLTVVVAVAAAFSASTATAHGCTPGFWKNRAITLNLYVPNATVSSVGFVSADFGTWTLVQALQGGGGNTLVDKKQILLRAAVAGYLNYTLPGSDYNTQIAAGVFGSDGSQETAGEFVAIVNAALASSDAAAITSLASWIDFKNNESAPAICA